MEVDVKAISMQVNAAMENKLLIKFKYEKPGEKAEVRRAIPYEMASTKEGHYLARCYDIDRGEVRAFRLDRFDDEDVQYFQPQDFLSEEKWEAIDQMYLTA